MLETIYYSFVACAYKIFNKHSFVTFSVMKLSRRLLDYILYLSLLILMIWIIGKISGLIQSPVWIDMVPYAAALVGAGIFIQKVTQMGTDLKQIGTKVNAIDSRVIKIEAKLEDKTLKEIEGFKEKTVEEK